MNFPLNDVPFGFDDCMLNFPANPLSKPFMYSNVYFDYEPDNAIDQKFPMRHNPGNRGA